MGNIIDYNAFNPPKYIQNNLNIQYKQGTSYIEIIPRINLNINKVIIFSHGNSCDIYGIYTFLIKLSNTFNINVISYDYPGYGLTLGSPTEKSCIDSLNNIISGENRKIILIGHSIGTGVIISYCYNFKYNPELLILISPFKSISNTIFNENCASFIDSSITSCGGTSFNSINYIKNINCKIKIYHGDRDELFSIDHPKSLYKKVENRCILNILNGIGHNNILDFILKKNDLIY